MKIKNMIIEIVTFFLLGIIFTGSWGCQFNSTLNNREKDKIEGEKTVKEFYRTLKNEDYKNAYKYFSRKYFLTTDAQKLFRLLTATREKSGSVISYNVEVWQTQTVVSTDTKSYYLFICNVNRSNFPSKESITLKKENDTIKIIQYIVNSNGH